MRHRPHGISRRGFLRVTTGGLLAGLAAPARVRSADSGATTTAALIHGERRAENTFRALKLIEDDVRRALRGKKRIVIKPNFVSTRRQLAATHAGCVEGILEFLQPLVKGAAEKRELVIAESPAGGPAAAGYSNFGYVKFGKKYGVTFAELDECPVDVVYVTDHRWRPQPVRFARILRDPETFLISAAVMKTHDRVVTTLSLKNVAVGGAIKDTDFGRGRRRSRRGRSDKPIIHGGKGNAGIHYNLFSLAKFAPPHLAVIDGFQAMEGNGPGGGTPVDHKVVVASADWLAADRIACELMGIDVRKVGYLWFSACEGLGQGNLEKIELRGARLKDHIRSYKMHANIASQFGWMEA